MTAEPLRVLSLGAGVQSTTLLLLALEGELPRPDLVVFADTQWEPAAVYRHLAYLEGLMAAAGVPFQRVSKGNLREFALRSIRGEVNDFPGIPLHVSTPRGTAMLRRQCTEHYKIHPIRRAARAAMLAAGKKAIEQWMGISVDEAQRMKPSGVKYITNRYPLVERRISRNGCLAWLEERGYARPPRSACLGCPYKNTRDWRELKAGPLEEWADAVEFDALARHVPRITGEAFLHYSRIPLPMVDLSTEQERGQMEMWGDECAGVCGV